MDPPPIHVQIQPHHARHRKNNKGTFTKVPDTSTRKTSNYRIRTLADGRIGQRRANQSLPTVANRPHDEAVDEAVDNPPIGDPPTPHASGTPAAAPKKPRPPRSNTWAVSLEFTYVLSTYADRSPNP